MLILMIITASFTIREMMIWRKSFKLCWQTAAACLISVMQILKKSRNTSFSSDAFLTRRLFGKEAPDALADFEFNEEGTKLLKCAAGHEPVSQSYTKSTRQCRFSFDRNHCAGCPYQNQCHPKIYKKVASFITSKIFVFITFKTTVIIFRKGKRKNIIP